MASIHVAQHETTAATSRLENFFQLISDLRGRAGQGGIVAGGESRAVLEEFGARDLGVTAE